MLLPKREIVYQSAMVVYWLSLEAASGFARDTLTPKEIVTMRAMRTEVNSIVIFVVFNVSLCLWRVERKRCECEGYAMKAPEGTLWIYTQAMVCLPHGVGEAQLYHEHISAVIHNDTDPLSATFVHVHLFINPSVSCSKPVTIMKSRVHRNPPNVVPSSEQKACRHTSCGFPSFNHSS